MKNQPENKPCPNCGSRKPCRCLIIDPPKPTHTAGLLEAAESALFWFEQYAEDNTDKHCRAEMQWLTAAIKKAKGEQ